MTIEQCDMDAAKSILWVSTIIDDQNAIAETFAAQRLAERARCFAYIREQAGECSVLAAGINQIDWARAEDHQPIIGEDGAVNVDATFNWSGASTVGHDIFAAFTAMLDQIERTDND